MPIGIGTGIGVSFAAPPAASGTPPVHGPSLLLEDGFYLLLEDGTSSLLLE